MITPFAPISRTGALVFALALTFGAAVAAAQSSRTTPAPPLAASEPVGNEVVGPTLHPGDVVKITVWRAPELSGEFPVAPDGMLLHPAFPSLYVVGVPLPRLQTMLDSAVHTENVNARVAIQPELQVIISGNVRKPDVYHLPVGTSIMQALVTAGGPDDAADTHRLELVRGGESRWFNLADPSGPASRTLIASGDQLLLGSRGASFREVVLPWASVLSAAASIYLVASRHH